MHQLNRFSCLSEPFSEAERVQWAPAERKMAWMSSLFNDDHTRQ